MLHEKISQEFRLKNIVKAKNYFIKEINLQGFRLHWTLILESTVNGCVSVGVFALLFVIPIVIASSSVGLKISVIT